MTTSTVWQNAVLGSAVLLTSCGAGLGEPCGRDVACPAGLVCRTPITEGEPSAKGVCDYALRRNGEPCTAASECDARLTCSNGLQEGARRYGTCVPRLPDGTECHRDLDCDSGKCAGVDRPGERGTCQPRP